VVVVSRHIKYYKQPFISDITGRMSFGIRIRHIILYNVVRSISTTWKDNEIHFVNTSRRSPTKLFSRMKDIWDGI